jgi:hypothetical protein
MIEGAQYACSTKNNTFSVLPYNQSSSDPNPQIEPGFKILPEGTSNLKCRLGNHNIGVEIKLGPPAGSGRCGAVGAISIIHIVVDGMPLNDKPFLFHWTCDNFGNPVTKIAVRVEGKNVAYEKCTTEDFDPYATDPKQTCFTKKINVVPIPLNQAETNIKQDEK